MIDNIREAIIELEKKHYRINEIKLNDDILKLLADSFNKIYGENALDLSGINTLYGYEVIRNLCDNKPVVFDVSINIKDILGSDKE